MRDFRKLTIWREGIDLVKRIYGLSNLLPKEEFYGLKSQIQRASVSIPSNISEGCSRNSDLEFKRFLEIAMGSSFELETQLVIIQELQMVSELKINDNITFIHQLKKKINSLITKLK